VPIERQPQTTAGRISITAIDGTGRWIQDLRTQDLNLYEDGIQRPVLSLQRDVETPASIGIVVDTSDSMSWKPAAAEAALQHFVRGGVLIYTVGIGTTGAPAMEMGPMMIAPCSVVLGYGSAAVSGITGVAARTNRSMRPRCGA